MSNNKRRADLTVKWQFTEGRRARAVWIDGPMSSRKNLRRLDLTSVYEMLRHVA